MSMDSQEEEEKIVNISKNEDFNKEYEAEGDPEEEDFSQEPQNPIENPSVIHNYSQEEELFQSQSHDPITKEKNESSANFSYYFFIYFFNSPDRKGFRTPQMAMGFPHDRRSASMSTRRSQCCS